eukprot:scaffold1313_cov250-Pinguiococcus_pyrenoidosus.AAC.12
MSGSEAPGEDDSVRRHHGREVRRKSRTRQNTGQQFPALATDARLGLPLGQRPDTSPMGGRKRRGTDLDWRKNCALKDPAANWPMARLKQCLAWKTRQLFVTRPL